MTAKRMFRRVPGNRVLAALRCSQTAARAWVLSIAVPLLHAAAAVDHYDASGRRGVLREEDR